MKKRYTSVRLCVSLLLVSMAAPEIFYSPMQVVFYADVASSRYYTTSGGDETVTQTTIWERSVDTPFPHNFSERARVYHQGATAPSHRRAHYTSHRSNYTRHRAHHTSRHPVHQAPGASHPVHLP